VRAAAQRPSFGFQDCRHHFISTALMAGSDLMTIVGAEMLVFSPVVVASEPAARASTLAPLNARLRPGRGTAQRSRCADFGGLAAARRCRGRHHARLFIHRCCARVIHAPPAMHHEPNRPEDVFKVATNKDGKGGDDAADCRRYAVASKPREVRMARLRGVTRNPKDEVQKPKSKPEGK
jgi:hypothetical protein